MAELEQMITLQYLAGFFRLDDSPEDTAKAQAAFDGLVRMEFKHAEAIVSVGDDANGMYFIESGVVEVIGADGSPLNELFPGQHFGEYAVLTHDRRMSTVRAQGNAVVYRMSGEALLDVLAYKPTSLGSLIHKLYDQITNKHSKVMELTAGRRGLIHAPQNQKRRSALSLFIHYGLVACVFAVLGWLCPAEARSPIWPFLPMLFLVAYMVITKRTLESLVLACILAFVMLEKGRFVIGVYGGLLTTLSDGDTASILLSIALIGGLSRLLSRAGGVGALNKAVSLRIKSRAGVLICGLLCVVVLFIDDYLGLMVAGVCFIPLADARRVPREMSGFVIGSPTEAVSTLVPLSVWSVFLAGLITAAGGGGFTLYLSSIPFNFTSLLTVCLCALAALGKLPLLGGMKAAQARVDRGEALWPSGSEQYLSEENLNMRGSVMNILAPLLVLIGASIGLGVLESGRFSVNIGSGLIATLLFLFPFYCLQRIFTPEAFFDELTAGIEGMITPILMLLMTMLFTLAIDALGFSDVLAHFVPLLLGGRFEWLPAALFAVFALIAALLGSSWSMYTIAIPVAVALAAPVGGWAAPLFIGAVCAAGIAGDSLSAYHSDSFLTASVIGLNPLAYYTSKLPYALIAAGLSLALYIGIGFWVL